MSHTRQPLIISKRGKASIRKGHCNGKEKDTQPLFTPVTTWICIDPIHPHDERQCYHNDKESMSTGMASINRTFKKKKRKRAVTCDEKCDEAAGGGAYGLQDV